MKNILGTTEDLKLYNKEVKLVYQFKTNSYGYSYEHTYDEKGNILTHKDSNGESCERSRDESGNVLTYKDSND